MADGKEIGKAVNQLLGGVGSLVAGMFLGPSGASGVLSAANAVDKLIDAAVPDEKEKPVTSAAETAPMGASKGPAQPVTEDRVVLRKEPPPEKPAPSATGAALAEEALRAAGWEPGEVLAAFRGPQGGRVILNASVSTNRGASRGGAEPGAAREELVRVTTKRT